MSRRTRQVGTLVLTAAAIAYLVWKVDLGTTLDVLADTNLAWFALAVAIMVVTVPVLALRWGWLLASHAIHERVPWLTRAYFVAYTAGQVLPTSLGGDAVRVVETTRRHPGRGTVVTGTVLLERGLSGATTVALGAVGFLLSIGEYDVSAYLWLEGVFVFGTLVAGFLFFARSARPLLRRTQPLFRRFRLEKPIRHLYEGVHHYRSHPGLIGKALSVTLVVQAVRILSIWASAKAVGIDLDPRIYYVFGPLLFLVMLVPFTLNGLAVREAFFVSFLGSVGVSADQAFAAGFLYFLLTLLLAFPGALIMLRDGLRSGPSPEVGHG
jgi:glycosyltransferase 2 family protein